MSHAPSLPLKYSKFNRKIWLSLDFWFLYNVIWQNNIGCFLRLILIFFIYFHFILFSISWRLISLQYFSGFCHTLTWISHGFICIPPPSLPDPSGSSQCTRPKHLSHASNMGWWSASHSVTYMFRCCSLETYHPRLLPQSPKSVLYICVSFSVFHIGLLLPTF